MSHKVQVWDLAIRFFHWSQVLLIASLWYTGTEGYMAEHQLLAYTLLALIIARVIWAVMGSKSARVSHFAASPIKAINYLKKPYAVNGHNPASFYMIIMLIVLVLIQLISGLATFDNSYMSDGPLVGALSSSWVDFASKVHKLNIDILLIAIGLHILAAILHSVRLHNVIAVMITGKDKPINNEHLTFVNSAVYFVLVAVLLVIFYFWQGEKLVALL